MHRNALSRNVIITVPNRHTDFEVWKPSVREDRRFLFVSGKKVFYKVARATLASDTLHRVRNRGQWLRNTGAPKSQPHKQDGCIIEAAKLPDVSISRCSNPLLDVGQVPRYPQ